MNILMFQKMKPETKITMVTCYDHWSARILNTSPVDAILVGDSVAMVIHGYDTTINATVDMMATHTRAVSKGAPDKLIVADLPFLSYRKDLSTTMHAVHQLLINGATAVKIEGLKGNEVTIPYIVDSGVPVMGHLGLTPQFYHQLGGFKVQAKNKSEKQILLEQAKTLQDLGCFSLVLECVPSDIAQTISETLTIPIIGIGAGSQTDGQILVLHDLLGVNSTFHPKFVRNYAYMEKSISEAVSQYCNDVTRSHFPNTQESFQ